MVILTNFKDKKINNIWNIINDQELIKPNFYTYLIKSFEKQNEYNIFIKTILDYEKKIDLEINKENTLINFNYFISKYENEPNKFINNIGEIINLNSYLAFIIANQLNINILTFT